MSCQKLYCVGIFKDSKEVGYISYDRDDEFWAAQATFARILIDNLPNEYLARAYLLGDKEYEKAWQNIENMHMECVLKGHMPEISWSHARAIIDEMRNLNPMDLTDEYVKNLVKHASDAYEPKTKKVSGITLDE